MNIKSNLLPYLRGIGLALWMGVILSFSVVGQTPDHSSSDVQPASELPSASDALEPKITATTANPPTAPLTFVWRIHELSKGAFIEPSLMVEVAEEANDPSDPKPKSPIVSNPSDPVADPQFESTRHFDWNAALKQSFYFNTLLHGVRLAIEPDVRAELGGPFFKEYLRSVKSLRGWDDGDNFLTNYVGHPMQGAVSGRIQIHNEPKGRKQEFGLRKEYFKSRFRAMGFAAMFSANFELGLMSEASIGNVGMKPREKSRNPMAFEDLVVTPTLGTVWLVGEDALDRFLVQKLESKTTNRVLKALVRSGLNPTRSMANIMRLKVPWYRDSRPL